MNISNRNLLVDAFILAGGESSRMGRTKSLLELGSVPMILRTARMVTPLVDAVIVVGPPERYAALGLQAIPDADFGIAHKCGESNGPLIGIATALASARAPWNLVLACDLPFLTTHWLAWLLERAKQSRAHVVLPRTAQGLEPLAAVYSAECAPQLIEALRRGTRKLQQALQSLDLEILAEDDWRAFDPGCTMLKNMNTPADYDEARAWWNSPGFPEALLRYLR